MITTLSFSAVSANGGNIFILPGSTIIPSVENVTMMTTKETMELMEHQYVA